MATLIKGYIYRLSDGLFMYEHIGPPDYVIHDLQKDKDFTLTPPPDSEHQWRWLVDKWVADED